MQVWCQTWFQNQKMFLNSAEDKIYPAHIVRIEGPGINAIKFKSPNADTRVKNYNASLKLRPTLVKLTKA